MKKYMFYGWEDATMSPVTSEYPGILSPQMLYDALCEVWCAKTCTSRLRDSWSPENKTLGQCSITAFLVQDIFGGKVYGILREKGTIHCYNVIDNVVFDLTSEQFGSEVLDYTNNPEQSRDVHFANAEKKARYELLKSMLKAHLDAS